MLVLTRLKNAGTDKAEANAGTMLKNAGIDDAEECWY